MYARWLEQRAPLARCRIEVGSHLDERNVECYLAWRRKWDRGFVGVDPCLAGRALYDRYYALARALARAWMARQYRSRVSPLIKSK